MRLSLFIKKTSYGFEVWTMCGPREVFETKREAEKYIAEHNGMPVILCTNTEAGK